MLFRMLAIAIVLVGGTAVAAEDTATLDKMVQMNRQALDQLKVGKKEAARDGLLEAIVVGKRAGLATHQMMARTYLHLGAVYLTGFGDREKALRQFESAVKIKPNIQLTPAVLTPTVQEVFEAARTQVGGAPPAAEAKAEPEAKAKAEPEAKPEPKPAPVAAEEPKAEPRSDPKPAPAAETSTRRTRPGRQAKGRPITHVAAEHPVAKPEPEPSVEAGVSAALEESEEAAGRDRAHPWWVGLGVGSGVGFHGQRVLESRTDYSVPAGISFAALAHLSPEVGYRLNDRWALSLQSQHQVVPRNGTVENGMTDNRPRMAHAIFARAHYRLLGLNDRLEVWGTGTVGGGSAIRLYVPANPDVGLPSSDTIAAGPFALGPGGYVIYHATRRVGLVAELRALMTVGGFAALAEFNLGASCTF
jgi:Tfp pilus assembly protein PilF